jgi:hypothetical protein
MADDQVQFDQEIEDLKHELENFQQEKERVRKIIGKIGGMPTFHEKLMNIVFIVVIVVSVTISFFADEKLRLLMIEIATVALSLKIIYLIHCQMKINHFKFWILSSLEWRLNEMMKILKRLDKSEDS